VSVYAEVEPDQVSVFVRDRGAGFDPGAVPGDRMGIKESIVGRMERSGGRALVHSEVGRGTRVELRMERTA
jgi:signal transduction histidine kinase